MRGVHAKRAKRHREGPVSHRWSKVKDQRRDIEEADPGHDACVTAPSSCHSAKGQVRPAARD
jgi:hypothetical protein